MRANKHPADLTKLGRRERQIMEVIHRLGRATAAEVLDALPNPPGYSSVRSMLRVLESKGFVKHEWEGPRYVYLPTTDLEHIQQSAARHLLDTFFRSSVESAVTAMLGLAEKPLSEDEAGRLGKLIEQAKRKRR